MTLSHRITTLTPDGDDGWGLFYRSRQMIAAGEPVTELTIGEHDIRTDASILEAMHRAAAGGHTGYASVPGTPALRQAVADRISQRTGVATTPDNVLITPGGQAGLFAAHMAVLNPGDTAGYIDPYYTTYPGTLRGAGAVPLPITTRAAQNFQPQAEDLRALKGAASLLVNSPNNPTGVIYDAATMGAIAAAAQEHDLWLISDEVYDTQVWEGAHISPRALPGMASRTLVVGSMSKSHAMTGSRIGWVVGPTEAIAHMTNLATHTTYGVPGYIQDAAVFALGEGEALEEKIAAPFRRRRAIAAKALAGQNVVRALPAMGAMYLMLDIRATGLSGAEFGERLLDTHRIAVMPGESFGTSAAGHIRVAMTTDDAAFEAALHTLVAFAQGLA
ncbi:pyridoxal phosphate-dependent aminotransferase [Alphaproteobacteria bacterium KMM 3653]|uniref:Aminotransferase n=1 Tax=Harenicola maris TaxID=2841044 RepID=A0AAP2CP10_9RHOB|nr:pyridoxal phosphate-dependent aminotransferase [Harenicola maris]